ncbi:uncharacterized protein LOC135391540 [Ornithodoros turicata]|uniref:uncharacterized protein LOC135391540 n=1 Tax=Ornithodoros turicata TaxID=34597 RepID=UPI003139DA73
MSEEEKEAAGRATAEDSWKVRFAFKMGNVRKSIKDEPDVDRARSKYGRKRPASETQAAQAKRLCRALDLTPNHCTAMEDDAHHANTVEAIKCSLSSVPEPNIEQLMEQMGSTFGTDGSG